MISATGETDLVAGDEEAPLTGKVAAEELSSHAHLSTDVADAGVRVPTLGEEPSGGLQDSGARLLAKATERNPERAGTWGWFSSTAFTEFSLPTIRDHGTTMLIIEQNVERGLALADRVFVIEKGAIALSGEPQELRGNPRLGSLHMGETCRPGIVWGVSSRWRFSHRVVADRPLPSHGKISGPECTVQWAVSPCRRVLGDAHRRRGSLCDAIAEASHIRWRRLVST
jgi:hypothetical protein